MDEGARTHSTPEIRPQIEGREMDYHVTTAPDMDTNGCLPDKNGSTKTTGDFPGADSHTTGVLGSSGRDSFDNGVTGRSGANSERDESEQSQITQQRTLPKLDSFVAPGISLDLGVADHVDSNNNPSIVAVASHEHDLGMQSDSNESDCQSAVTTEVTMRQTEPMVASPGLDVYDTSLGQDNGDGKRTNRRGSAWTDHETDFLFEVWALHSQSKNGEEFGVHNAPIYRLISKAMADVGYVKSAEQCKTRIHTLKRAYKLTKEETLTGNPSITYCRHFDKLEVIMGDNPNLTPQSLSESLAAKRRTRVLQASTEKAPTSKRSRGHSASRVKRPSTSNNSRPVSSVSASEHVFAPTPPKQIVHAPQISEVQVLPNVNTFSAIWNASSTSTTVSQSTPYPYILSAALQSPSSFLHHDTINQSNQSAVSQTQVENTKVYASPEANSHPENQHCALPEVNNNTILVKEEKQATPEYGIFEQSPQIHAKPETRITWNQPQPIQTQQIAPPQPEVTQKNAQKSKEDLERLKLDLEMRKLDMERTKLEMEDRQRREEREHQYRMMQLLLYGLGQQNAVAFGAAGQMADTVETHGADLSRAIENGLVPGGAHGANEKGLSFNEI